MGLSLITVALWAS